MFVITKKQRIRKMMEAAREDFEKALKSDLQTMEVRQLRRRVANRCRGHIDQTFIDGAELFAAYIDALEQSKRGGEAPEPPQGRTYITLPSLKGEIYSYMPRDIVDPVFQLGREYQTMLIGAQTAIVRVQTIADELCKQLHVTPYFIALKFLREELDASSQEEAAEEEEEL